MAVILVPAYAGNPVGEIGLAGELEFLRPGLVPLDVDVVEVEVEAVGAFLCLAVVGAIALVRGQRSEVGERQRVFDAQDEGVVGARLARAVRFVVQRRVARIDEGRVVGHG